jgi:Ca2+/Na+ antiporter
MAFFGLAVVAIGAEIPDCIQSVTVAKKGYGSMAVSNGLGSQICNICVGLGKSMDSRKLLALVLVSDKSVLPSVARRDAVDAVNLV